MNNRIAPRYFALPTVFLLGLVASAQAAAPAATAAKAWTIDLSKGTGAVEFVAVGRPSGIKIVGKGDGPHGHFETDGKKVTGEAIFKMDSLDTGMDLRNHHMKEKYLEVQKFPESKLSVTEVNLPAGALGTSTFSFDKVPFKGTLKLHGVEKPVTGIVDLKGGSGKIDMVASFETPISDYGIDIPKFAGITVADKVQVKVTSSSPIAKH